MLKIEAINKYFGEIHAVRDLTLEIPPAKVTIVAGADGAGKSTLFKMIVGLVKKSSGSIYLNGELIEGNVEKITSVTGYMPERFSLYPDLSVEENLNFFADIHKVPYKLREQRKRELLETTGMSPFIKRRAGALSGGMKQKLALSTILLSAPQLIILDEPTTGVDPLSRIEFFNIIKGLKQEGKTIILSTPYLDEAEQGDNVVFLKEGGVIKEDSIESMRQNFPAKLWSVEPEGNIFDIMLQLEKHPQLKNRVYIRGKYIKYLQTGNDNQLNLIPHTHAVEEAPKLEDIYIYYERRHSNSQSQTNQTFCGGPGGGFSKEPPGRRRQHG